MADKNRFLAQRPLARFARRALLGVGFRGLIEYYGSHPQAYGLANLDGLEPPFLLAANHSSHMDTPLVLLSLPPKLRHRTLVAAAADYFFEGRPALSAFVSMAVGAVPIERRRVTRESMEVVRTLLGDGWNLLLYPEGSRTPDGRLYRGKTGVARIALEARVPVVPVGVVGTYDVLPAGRSRPQQAKVSVRFGKPLTFERYYDAPTDQFFVLRGVTDEIMYEIMVLAGRHYVDEYSKKPKKAGASGASGPAAAVVSEDSRVTDVAVGQ